MTRLVHGYQVNPMNVLSQQNLRDCLQIFRKLYSEDINETTTVP